MTAPDMPSDAIGCVSTNEAAAAFIPSLATTAVALSNGTRPGARQFSGSLELTFGTTAWTSDGFRASLGKEMKALLRRGQIESGLTFHGLRHTVGTLLREVTDDLDLIRRWLGQKTLAMAMHYSSTADISSKMRDAVDKLDPLGTKSRTKVSNAAEKVSNAR